MATGRPARRGRSESGFTLIELMTVVLIIAILLAIAIPTFIALRRRADDVAARETLVNAHRAVRAVAAERNDDLDTITHVELTVVEPSLSFIDAATAAEASDDEISVANGDNAGIDYVILATYANGVGCLAIRELEGTQPVYQRLAGAACPASLFDPTAGWQAEWPPS